MTVVTSLILIFLAVAAATVAAMRPRRPALSSFELKRRSSEGDESASLGLRREKAYIDILSLQRVLSALLLVLFTALALSLYSPWMGLLAAALLAMFMGAIGRVKPVRKFAETLYDEREHDLLRLTERYKAYCWWIRLPALEKSAGGVHSREELVHVIDSTRALHDKRQKQLLLNALAFHERRVDEVMTPRDKLVTVKKTEILGPLVLDDLHKSGHQSFTVINGDVDHVVGILRLSDVQTLDTTRKHTALAETAMRPNVQYVSQETSLEKALDRLLGSHEHILVIVDEDSRVVGLLTLSDIMRSLFGE